MADEGKSLEARFLQRLKAASSPEAPLDLAAGIEAMLAFYAEERPDGRAQASEDDRLIYQWGVKNWGTEVSVKVTMTRQLLLAGALDREPWEFVLTFIYWLSVFPGDPRGGNQECASPGQVAEFRRIIVESPAYRAVSRLRPHSAGLRYGRT